jgi:hypothetical protein
MRYLYFRSDNATEPYAQVGHGCGWRGARHGLAVHAAGCWYERGRRHLEQAQAAVRSNERRVEELKQANLAAAERAGAELAKVRAEAAAQLAALRVEFKAELKAEVATVKRESAAQVKKIPSSPLGQLQPFIAAFPLERTGQPASFGPT